MNKKFFLLFGLAIAAMLCTSAGEYNFDGTTFTISSNVKLPVYVRYDGNIWTITSRQYTLRTRIPNATITDSEGNNCMYTHKYDQHTGSDGNYVHHYYNITGVYSSSHRSQSNSDNSRINYFDNSSAAQLGSQLGSAAYRMGLYEQIYDYYHAGGFQLAPTISSIWGENLELRFRYGSSRFGGDVNGMIGHDWIKNINGILWNIGLGFYIGGRPSYLYLWDVDFGFRVGHCNNPDKSSMTITFDISTTHFIGPQHIIGLTAGMGIGGDGVKNPHFVFDVRGGIAIYFLQWNWF